MKVTIERGGKRATVMEGSCAVAVVWVHGMPEPTCSFRAGDDAELAGLAMAFVVMPIDRTKDGGPA